MKYKEMTSEDARKECKKHAMKDTKGVVLTKCEECPLRRTRKDEKGKEHTLYCYWRLQDLCSELCEEWEEMGNEEIKYLNEMEKQ